MNGERLGTREGAAPGAQCFFKFGTLGGRVLRGLDLAAEGHGDATLHRERASLCRWPEQCVAVRTIVRGARYAEGLVHLHGRPGHGCLRRGCDGRHPVADGRCALGVRTDHEPRLVDEVHDRQVEGIRQFDGAACLLRAIGAHGAGVEAAVIAENHHRLTVDARKSGNLSTPEQPAHLEEVSVVDHRTNDPAHVEGLAPIAGNGLEEPVLAPVHRIAARRARGQIVHGGRQERQKGANLLERVTLVARDVVDHAALRVHIRAAKLVLGDRPTQSALDEGRSADHDLCGVLGHDAEVRRHETTRGKSGNGAKRRGGNRDLAERVGDDPEAWLDMDRFADGTAALPGPAHAAAATLEHAHQRYAVRHGQVFSVDTLAQARRVRRSALEREVLTADDDAAPLNATEADHVVRRSPILDRIVRRIFRACRGAAEFAEAAFVEHRVDALTDRELAARMVLLDAGFAAHGTGVLAPTRDLVDFFLPGHSFLPHARRDAPKSVLVREFEGRDDLNVISVNVQEIGIEDDTSVVGPHFRIGNGNEVARAGDVVGDALVWREGQLAADAVLGSQDDNAGARHAAVGFAHAAPSSQRSACVHS